MERTFEEKMTELSAQCRSHIRSGQIAFYSQDLKEMAKLFRGAGHFHDQVKMLFLSFYIDLSGFGKASFIDHAVVERIPAAVSAAGMESSDIEQLYFELIYPDMMDQHVMSVKDSWYLLQLCLDGKIEQAEWALSKI